MTQPVLLSICGRQHFAAQEPDVIEFMTEGVLESKNGGWDIRYEESDLTGMAGVTTTFRVEPEQVILRRTGKLRSEMIFKQGVCHTSLYQMDFGALMINVCARQIEADIGPAGGTVDLLYAIEIEQNATGLVEYHLDIKVK